MLFELLRKKNAFSVDIVFAGCYSYHDRRSTTVGATADVATTDVTKTGRR